MGLVYCSFDTETTSLNHRTGHIVEIGAIKFNDEGVIDTFESLVNPLVSIPADAIAVHGITDSMVYGAPLIKEVLEKFTTFIADVDVYIGHNPRFDTRFLEQVGLDINHVPTIDTKRLAKRVYPSLENYRLGTLMARLESDFQWHRALGDAQGCMKVFIDCVNRLNASLTRQATLEELLEVGRATSRKI